LPFVTEMIYQNLVRNSEENTPESIHHCDYPEPDEKWINEDLIQNVHSLKKLVELGRSARSQSSQKIRQPLPKVNFAVESNSIATFVLENQDIVLDELNVKAIERITEADNLISYRIKPNLRTLGQKYGKGLSEIRTLLDNGSPVDMVREIQSNHILNLKGGKYELTREDLFIETVAEAGFVAASDRGITVSLSLELTADLVQEGIVREVVRMVQNLRKDAGFAVEDRIEVSWDLDGKIDDALRKFATYFCEETLTVKIKDNLDKADHSDTLKINEKEFNIQLKKV